MLQQEKMTSDFVSLTNQWHEMMFINISGMPINETVLYVGFEILYLKNEHEVYFVYNSYNEHVHSSPCYNKQL